MLIPTFLGVTVVAFGLIHLIPGDPIELLAGGNRAKHRCSACSMAAFTDALIQPSG
jgi:ABC-type dipeptide/oligopeptide/nickel transport system permease component